MPRTSDTTTAMDSTGQHSFLHPTTCFTVACVAFSVLACSLVWKNSQSLPLESTSPQNHDTPPKKRPGAVRRKAVDSIYLGPEESANLRQRLEVSPEPILASSDPLTTLASLIALCAEISKGLRSSQKLAHPRLTNASILGELSLITTSLCRLQQQLATNTMWFTDGSGFAACFEASATGLNETLLLLRAELGRTGGRDDEAWQVGLVQLKDHRPAMEFLLESATANSLPPTPPEDEDVDQTLTGSSLLPTPAATGMTPAPDAMPPPYSPPAHGRINLIEKADVKSEEGPPEVLHKVEAERVADDELYAAATMDDVDLVSDLLARGADANLAIGELQRTALHQAAHLNHCASLSALLRGGAIMNVEDSKGDTALHLAAWAGHVEALSSLLSHGADVDWLSGRDGYSPLWCAISGFHIDAARLLLKHGARVSLRSASGGGLLPLHQAAVTAQSAMCELLLDRGAQVDSLDEERNTPLHYAAASGSAAVVKVLLRGGAPVDLGQAQGLTPGHWAAHKGHADVLGMLLAYGASVNAKAAEAATPLHMAANRGHLPCVRLLLEKGARRSSRAEWDGTSGTAADMAQEKDHVRVARAIETWKRG